MKLNPRIYLYKITFEEVPYYYYGIHSERTYGENYMGSPIKHKWAWKFYTPQKSILQTFDSWEEAAKVEERVIKYFLGKDSNCLNACAGKAFLNRKGKENHCYGTHWWNNGIKNQRTKTCPGENWKRGKMQESLGYKSGSDNINAGKKWWNNGQIEVLARVSPNDSWVRGRINMDYLLKKRNPLTSEHKEKLSKALTGKMVGNKNPMSKEIHNFTKEHLEKLKSNSMGRKWWNDGSSNKFQVDKPGPDWELGMITNREVKC